MADLPTNFIDMLNEADSIVKADYPDAQFYEASLNLELLGSGWQFVFSSPPTATVFLYNREGQFGSPEYIDKPWGGDIVIPLPISLDLSDALSLCEQNGCGGGEPGFITLRHPLVPGDNEPYYIFAFPSVGKRCFVGVNTQQVTCDPLQPDG